VDADRVQRPRAGAVCSAAEPETDSGPPSDVSRESRPRQRVGGESLSTARRRQGLGQTAGRRALRVRRDGSFSPSKFGQSRGFR